MFRHGSGGYGRCGAKQSQAAVMLMMTELLICEVMTAQENHEPVDVEAATQRCRNYLPQHPETDDRLKARLQHLAMEYGAGVVLQ